VLGVVGGMEHERERTGDCCGREQETTGEKTEFLYAASVTPSVK
jgi:hypothetical protein